TPSKRLTLAAVSTETDQFQTLAVFGLMWSALPISGLLRPSAIERRTSSSRGVRPAASSGPAASAPARSILAWRELVDLLEQRPGAAGGSTRACACQSLGDPRARSAGG